MRTVLACALAGAVIGTGSGMGIQALTGYASVWSGLLLDLGAMLGFAALLDLRRDQRQLRRAQARTHRRLPVIERQINRRTTP